MQRKMHPIQRGKNTLAIPRWFERVPLEPLAHKLRDLGNRFYDVTVTIYH
jgi:hypothetical protein